MSLPSLLLLASPDDTDLQALVAALAPDWAVTVCVPRALFRYAGEAAALTELRHRAREAAVVLHLSADGAAALAGLAGLAEVYAPAELALCRPGPAEMAEAEAWEALWRRERDLARRCRRLVVPDADIGLKARLLYGVGDDRLRVAAAGALPALVREALAEEPRAVPSPAPGFTLALNDYLVIDRQIGGAVRVRQGLAALGADTVLLSLGIYGAVRFVAPRVLQVSVPKSGGQRALEADLRALAGSGLEDIASATHAPLHGPLVAVAADLARRANVAVFEHCYLAPLLDVIHAAAPGLPVVYDAHNVESRLKRELLAGHPAEAALCGYVDEVERRLVDAAALVLCCSEADAAVFRPRARRVVMMPHGVTPALATSAPIAGAAVKVGFLGSTHPPNVAAVRFILGEFAPRFPEVVFEIVGSVCAGLSTVLPNVKLLGAVPEAAKEAALAGWSVALNPVEGGSGASLKLADYLAHGLPTLNTVHAARGFSDVLAGAGLVAPLEAFPESLRHLLDDAGLLDRLREAASRVASARSWPSVAREAREAIQALAAAYRAPEAKLLLAVGEAAARRGRMYPNFARVDVLMEGEAPALPDGADRLVDVAGPLVAQSPIGALPDFINTKSEWIDVAAAFGVGQDGEVGGSGCGLLLPAGSLEVSMRWEVSGSVAVRLYCGGVNARPLPLLLDTVLEGDSRLRLPLPALDGPVSLLARPMGGPAWLLEAALTEPFRRPIALDMPPGGEVTDVNDNAGRHWVRHYAAVMGSIPGSASYGELAAPAGPEPEALRWGEVADLLAEAASARGGVAARQALGLEQTFALVVGDASVEHAEGFPVVAYRDGEASHQDADGQLRRMAMPIGWLLLSAAPACRLLVVDSTADAALVELASLAGVPGRRG